MLLDGCTGLVGKVKTLIRFVQLLHDSIIDILTGLDPLLMLRSVRIIAVCNDIAGRPDLQHTGSACICIVDEHIQILPACHHTLGEIGFLVLQICQTLPDSKPFVCADREILRCSIVCHEICPHLHQIAERCAGFRSLERDRCTTLQNRLHILPYLRWHGEIVRYHMHFRVVRGHKRVFLMLLRPFHEILLRIECEQIFLVIPDIDHFQLLVVVLDFFCNRTDDLLPFEHVQIRGKLPFPSGRVVARRLWFHGKLNLHEIADRTVGIDPFPKQLFGFLHECALIDPVILIPMIAAGNYDILLRTVERVRDLIGQTAVVQPKSHATVGLLRRRFIGFQRFHQLHTDIPAVHRIQVTKRVPLVQRGTVQQCADCSPLSGRHGTQQTLASIIGNIGDTAHHIGKSPFRRLVLRDLLVNDDTPQTADDIIIKIIPFCFPVFIHADKMLPLAVKLEICRHIIRISFRGAIKMHFDAVICDGRFRCGIVRLFPPSVHTEHLCKSLLLLLGKGAFLHQNSIGIAVFPHLLLCVPGGFARIPEQKLRVQNIPERRVDRHLACSLFCDRRTG